MVPEDSTVLSRNPGGNESQFEKHCSVLQGLLWFRRYRLILAEQEEISAYRVSAKKEV